MDLKMHDYSVPLRSPFAFPCVPWNFEVGERIRPEIRGRELRSPNVTAGWLQQRAPLKWHRRHVAISV